jgi:tetratricopeptide (TPR) repeat protein
MKYQSSRSRIQSSLILQLLLALCIAGGLPVWGAENVSSNAPTAATAPPADTAKSDTAAPPDANASDSAPEPGLLPTPGVVDATNVAKVDQLRAFQVQLDLARTERREKSTALAATTLVALLQTNAPAELQRQALFELALVEQDAGQAVKAQQIFSQYLNRYPEDPSAPEVLLRQGLLYRQMGINTLAVSKFYAVMSTALKLNLANMDYYKKLVLQAQVEIADTYYLEGSYVEAADFFGRLLKTDATGFNKPQIQLKLIRSLSCLTNHMDTIAKAGIFLEIYPNSSDVQEVRFLLASALKQVGRNQESMKQVLLLLQSQAENVQKNPEVWIYWQQKAGNEIANQLYKEGDYLNALEIYLSLADLNKSPAWQLPVWYQTALVYEQLQQWQKASDMYGRILDRQKELTDAEASPSLHSLFDMAQWRKDYIAWMQKSKATNLTFRHADTRGQSAAPGQ